MEMKEPCLVILLNDCSVELGREGEGRHLQLPSLFCIPTCMAGLGFQKSTLVVIIYFIDIFHISVKTSCQISTYF